MSEINLDNKYLFHEENFSLKCKRYGEPWREFVGDKAIGRLYGFALELQALLRMAKCPNCDGSGCIAHKVSNRQHVTRDMAIDAGDESLEGSLYSDDEWEQEHCQWCDDVKQILETVDDTQTPTAD